MNKILFLCSQNKLRPPTVEDVFVNEPDIEARSVGLNLASEVAFGSEDVEWRDCNGKLNLAI